MTTYNNKLRPTQLESLFTIFNPVTSRQNFYVNLISLNNANLEKANKLTNTSRSFSLLSDLWMR
jgi:hypothetical protein